MDDDLMSLRSNVSSSKNDDDDLLGSFGSPSGTDDALGLGDSSDLDFGSLDDQPEWLRDLGVQSEEAAPAGSPPKQAKKEKEKKKKKPARRSKKSSGNLMGLTAQQRMILALFLFLEVTVISILALVIIGAINIP